MEELKKTIITSFANELIPKLVTDYFEKIQKPKKRKIATSYMCWLKQNRTNFELCSTCHIPYIINNDNKKVCPKCHKKISAMEVAKMAGIAWKDVTADVKLKYSDMARNINKL